MHLFNFSLQLKKIDKCQAISRKRPNDMGNIHMQNEREINILHRNHRHHNNLWGYAEKNQSKKKRFRPFLGGNDESIIVENLERVQ